MPSSPVNQLLRKPAGLGPRLPDHTLFSKTSQNTLPSTLFMPNVSGKQAFLPRVSGYIYFTISMSFAENTDAASRAGKTVKCLTELCFAAE